MRGLLRAFGRRSSVRKVLNVKCVDDSLGSAKLLNLQHDHIATIGTGEDLTRRIDAARRVRIYVRLTAKRLSGIPSILLV